jgi:ATP-dependent Lon protease
MTQSNNREIERPSDESVIPIVATAVTRPSGRARRSVKQWPFPKELPLLPIRDNVYFPKLIFPLFVGREKSIHALDEILEGHRHIVLVTQRQVSQEDPEPEDIHEMGVVAEVLQVLKVPDGTMRVMLEGICRFRVKKYVKREPHFLVRGEPIAEDDQKTIQLEAMMRSSLTQFEQIVANARSIPPEAVLTLMNIEEPGRLADHITWHLPGVRLETKQNLLETLESGKRLEKLESLLTKEAEILEIQKNIRNRVEKEMGDNQREFLLREQLKAIQQELGERDEKGSEVDEYRAKIADAGMPAPVHERAHKELERLERMPYAAPDGVVVRNYLDWLVALPWSKESEERLDLIEAAALLDEDHYGLQKVKDRVLEFLSVRKLTGTLKGPILCFLGPPGVGKTSLGKSIARALGREFVRISLGGVRDEAEIRGHRRTYIGALPGRIIQGLKTAGTRNPVFMLDEIDKLSSDFRGDPSSALLEALDPEQNKEFSDHYLEAPFDLSNVMFITTANLIDPIPAALRDRMEVISFSSYIEDEKVAISEQFLLPKQLKDHGLTEEQMVLSTSAVKKIIREHTRESGVRNLEREIATVCRKVARKVAEGTVEPYAIDEDDISAYLGRRRFTHGVIEDVDQVGAAMGLVYTEVGGDVITIEVSVLPSKRGKLTLTGQLGDVMKESAQAALSYVRFKAAVLGIDEEIFHHAELHIHVPAGGVPKDGPSAGITMATALSSALSGRAVKRDLAMTGEITLRGRVLPIGGLKEKMIAAHRAGIRTAILPAENERDLDEIPDNVRSDMTFHLVSHMDDVLPLALMPLNKK